MPTGSRSFSPYYYPLAPGVREILPLGPNLQDLGKLSEQRPVHLTGIRIRQELRELCSAASENQTQELRLDALRIL